MKTALLRRQDDSAGCTPGIFYIYTRAMELLMKCCSMELLWKNNNPSVSCIPAGEYICKYTKSNSFSKLANERYFKKHGKKPEKEIEVHTYEIMNVTGRAGCRIHPANFAFQLRGCIALGSSHADINKDGVIDVTNSGKTIEKFENIMNKEDFKLIII
jgi:hypothetical protein